MDTKDFKIVFMGTPDFAVQSLKALIEDGFNIVGVITAPDKPAGRGRQLKASAVKVYAESQGLTVLQPQKLKDPLFIDELQALQADLQIVVAFRMLPDIVWQMPKYGTFNLHGSLLPQYRGAAPINWAIMNGDKESGVTTFFIDKEIDTGRVLFREVVAIDDDMSVGDLHDKLMVIGSSLVVKTVESIISGDIKAIPQDSLVGNETELRPAPKLFKDDCRLSWSEPIVKVYNQIRGLSPYPAAFGDLVDADGNETTVKIYKALKITDKPHKEVGSIETDNKTYIRVACADGFLEIQELQLAGKKRMAVDALLRGFDITGYRFV